MYKRQEKVFAENGMTLEEATILFFEETVRLGRLPFEPVSYTHLDVYKRQWILCPVCGSKTRNKIRKDTVLENYPLYYPKCRQERLIKVDNLKITVIKEPDA